MSAAEWRVYLGTGEPHDGIAKLPDPPPWRAFDGVAPDADGAAGGAAATDAPPSAGAAGPDGRTAGAEQRRDVVRRAQAYLADPEVVDMVNAALYLRRPLLVTGKPGTGKSTLAFAVAHELRLGPVLYWPITSRSSLADALYRYDAIGRLQEANLHRLNQAASPAVPDIGRYLRLGPLGTALLPARRPRVLLIDELDKSDIDLPNDLLNVFEEGEFEIPELTRLPEGLRDVQVGTAHVGGHAVIREGRVRCREFPFVVITSNGEREFSPAFLRRCLQLNIQSPDDAKLERIVAAHLGDDVLVDSRSLVERFVQNRDHGDLATDQLLNAIYLVTAGARPDAETRERLVDRLLRPIDDPAAPG